MYAYALLFETGDCLYLISIIVKDLKDLFLGMKLAP